MPGRTDREGRPLVAHSARGDDFYFAILPDRDARPRIAALAQRVRREHGLRGPAIAPDSLHISLQWAGEVAAQPETLIAAAKQAGAAIVAPCFLVSFDRVLSVERRDRRPLVLATSEELIALVALQKMLGAEIEKAGLGRRRQSGFEPHVTLLYDEQAVLEHRVEPIAWMVREFVLVQNRRGQGGHIQHARWPLRAPT